MVLANLSVFFSWKNIKSEYNNNKFEISFPTGNGSFILADQSYSISVIQHYFEFIIKKAQNVNWKSSSSNLPKQD